MKITLTGIFALLIFTSAVAPLSVKADFWDDVVDFMNPVEHVKNVIDGRPEDNLPPNPLRTEIIDPFCLYACDNEDNRTALAQNQTPPTVSFWAAPTMVSYNGASTLTWNSHNTSSCYASGGSSGWAGDKSTSGIFSTGVLTNTTTFNITCSNSMGSVNGSATVVVSNPPAQVCQDTTATNYGGVLPCTYPVQVCQDPSAINYQGTLPCKYATATCQNPTATNYGGLLPCVFNTQVCKDPSAINYQGTLPCRYSTPPISICQNPSATNYGGPLPCTFVHRVTPTVNITADDTRLDDGDNTRVRWNSNNANYCTASGGTNGWSGYQNTSGSFNTGSLTSDRTFRITCYNNNDSATDSVTIRVDEDDFDNDDENEPEVATRNATNISTTSATLNGRVDGNSSSARAWFEYGTSTYFGYTTTKNSYGSSSRNFSRNISGLMQNTTYYFRAVAENNYDRVYGNILTFRTTGSFTNPINNQPTVILYADQASVAYNGATTIRWSTVNSSSCFASGGTLGWAGAKSVGSGFFYTGSITSSRTFTLTCSNAFGYGSDSVTVSVRKQTSGSPAPAKSSTSPSSMVLIASSVERNQIGAPTFGNDLRPGDEVNYLVSYQNVSTASISGLTLRIDLDPQTYFISSNPMSSNKLGNIVIFNLGTLKGNEQGMVSVRALIQPNIAEGTNLNFTATLSYIDPSKAPKSVTTNASAQILGPEIFPGITDEEIDPQANVIGVGFLPTNIFGWFILFILVLVLLLLSRHLYSQFAVKKTVYVEDHHA